MFTARLTGLATLIAFALTSSASAAVIYSDDFSGSGAALNGTAPDVRPGLETWQANGPFRDNGTIDGTIEGGALLPATLKTNKIYTLSMDVLMPVGVDRWVALGFAQDPLPSLNADDVNARHSNEPEGIAWMLFRDHANNPQDVEIFRGRRTANQIADTNAVFTFGVTHNLKIVLDTSGNGSSYTANFLIDNVPIVAAPIVINSLGTPGGLGQVAPGNLLNQIRYVGFSYDDATANAPRVDNFLFTVPEPACGILVMGAVAGLLVSRRRVK
jgi:hypothetical protein